MTVNPLKTGPLYRVWEQLILRVQAHNGPAPSCESVGATEHWSNQEEEEKKNKEQENIPFEINEYSILQKKNKKEKAAREVCR